jgi:UDP-N-acetylglucosamine 2-epimerase (hydrolysing)
VEAHDFAAIERFLREEWGKPHQPHTAFGEGLAADRFVTVLRDPAFWARGLQKQFSDRV